MILNFDYTKKYDYENGFYLTSDSSRIGKLVSQYELYKKITGLSGDFVECGVFKGASLIRFATFRELLESQNSRKIIGFDMFGSFPRVDRDDDNDFIEKFENTSGGGIEKKQLEDILKTKGFRNIQLIRGDLTETIDEYLNMNSALRIALLHIDVDVYKPTKYVLERLFPRVVAGGLVVLDDYGMVNGATEAVDEYLEKNNQGVQIQKLPYYQVPAYIVK